MGDYTIKRTDEDFNIAFNGMLETARRLGINTKDEAIRQFVVHLAECRAEDHAQIRWMYNTFVHGIENNST